MILQHLILKNAKQIESANNLGLKEPKPDFKPSLLIVNINDVGFLYINDIGNIEIEVRGFAFEIAYNKNIIDAISENISKREK